MKSNHLTDEILQAFLLKEILDDKLETHIAKCSICRTKLENYQYLVASIQKAAPEPFSFDVTTVVMQKIELYEKQESIKKALVFWGLLIFFIGTVVLISLPFLLPILRVFYTLTLFTIIFIVGTSISVLIFLFSDIYKQYKIKEKILFEDNLQPIDSLPV